MSKEHNPFDFTRFSKFTIFNFLYVGPAQFIIFDKIFPILAPEKNFKGILKKFLFTSCFTGPLGLAFFFFTVSYMESRIYEHAFQEMKAKFVPTFLVAVKVWPFIQLFNFTFIPTHFQVFFINFVSVFWNAYLDYMKFTSDMRLETDMDLFDDYN